MDKFMVVIKVMMFTFLYSYCFQHGATVVVWSRIALKIALLDLRKTKERPLFKHLIFSSVIANSTTQEDTQTELESELVLFPNSAVTGVGLYTAQCLTCKRQTQQQEALRPSLLKPTYNAAVSQQEILSL